MRKNKFVVYDWAGNLMNWGEFKSADHAMSAILDRCPNDEDIQEYYVIEIDEDGNEVNS
jgi:hypothetical protein